MEGLQLGAYRIERKLGEGGMGVVYIGVDVRLGRRAAIKQLLPGLSSDRTIVERFFNEAKAAASINHPGIVEIYDVGWHSDGSAFFAMKLLEGDSLATRLRARGAMPIQLAATIARQIASALAAAHARGIVHRDLKPDNIVLVPDEEVAIGERATVLDFGIAKLFGDGPMTSKTRTGSVMGTPYYMSPEQCRGAGEIDHRTDVYALGCLVFEMLTGRPPFVAEGAGEILGMHQFVEPPTVRSLRPDVPPDLEAVVMRALAKRAEQRPQTMAELTAALQPFATQGARAFDQTPRPSSQPAAASYPVTPPSQPPPYGAGPPSQPPAYGQAAPSQPPAYGQAAPSQPPSYGQAAPSQPPSYGQAAPSQPPYASGAPYGSSPPSQPYAPAGAAVRPYPSTFGASSGQVAPGPAAPRARRGAVIGVVVGIVVAAGVAIAVVTASGGGDKPTTTAALAIDAATRDDPPLAAIDAAAAAELPPPVPVDAAPPPLDVDAAAPPPLDLDAGRAGGPPVDIPAAPGPDRAAFEALRREVEREDFARAFTHWSEIPPSSSHKKPARELLTAAARKASADAAWGRALVITDRLLASYPRDLELLKLAGIAACGAKDLAKARAYYARMSKLPGPGAAQSAVIAYCPSGFERPPAGTAASPPKPPADAPPAATAEQVTDEAAAAFRSGQHARSLKLAESALKLQPTGTVLVRALGLAILASCNLKNESAAKRYYARLSPSAKPPMRQRCLSYGIDPESGY